VRSAHRLPARDDRLPSKVNRLYAGANGLRVGDGRFWPKHIVCGPEKTVSGQSRSSPRQRRSSPGQSKPSLWQSKPSPRWRRSSPAKSHRLRAGENRLPAKADCLSARDDRLRPRENRLRVTVLRRPAVIRSRVRSEECRSIPSEASACQHALPTVWNRLKSDCGSFERQVMAPVRPAQSSDSLEWRHSELSKRRTVRNGTVLMRRSFGWPGMATGQTSRGFLQRGIERLKPEWASEISESRWPDRNRLLASRNRAGQTGGGF